MNKARSTCRRKTRVGSCERPQKTAGKSGELSIGRESGKSENKHTKMLKSLWYFWLWVFTLNRLQKEPSSPRNVDRWLQPVIVAVCPDGAAKREKMNRLALRPPPSPRHKNVVCSAAGYDWITRQTRQRIDWDRQKWTMKQMCRRQSPRERDGRWGSGAEGRMGKDVQLRKVLN